MNWTVLWPLVLVVTLVLFAAMAVLVTILGARDIRRLLAHLREPSNDHASRTSSDSTT